MASNTVAINTVREGATLVAEVGGRIDGSNARSFQKTLEAAFEPSDRAVALDMANLSYISSAGLRVVLMLAKTLMRQRAKLAVCSLSAPIGEVFKISGFDKIIPVHNSRAEAVAALQG